MIYTTITVTHNNLDKYKRDLIVKLGFIISGSNFIKSMKSSDIHIIISQLSKQNIAFTMNTQISNNQSRPCMTCKK